MKKNSAFAHLKRFKSVCKGVQRLGASFFYIQTGEQEEFRNGEKENEKRFTRMGKQNVIWAYMGVFLGKYDGQGLMSWAGVGWLCVALGRATARVRTSTVKIQPPDEKS